MKKGSEREDLKRIFKSAVDRADPYKMLTRHVKIEGNALRIDFGERAEEFRLEDFDAIHVFGTGKAAAKMAKAAEEIFRDRLSGGIVSVKYGHTEKLERIRTVEAGHPIPDGNSLKAAEEMMKTAEHFTDRTLVIQLVSGGGSSLLESPAPPLTLDDLQKTTKALLDCGADIEEINCIRKHLSAVKGGKFARVLYPATTLSFILSDVVGDRIESIASGLTVDDPTTYRDALDVISRYDLEAVLPPSVLGIIRRGTETEAAESPSDRARIFSRVHNFLIGTNYHSLLAASKTAGELGYHPVVLSSQLTGEARELARFFIGIGRDVLERGLLAELPACIIGGGETTVTIRGKGKGGRNQEMALAFLSELGKDGRAAGRIHFLAASTDGSDGPTDAAGAFASGELLKRAAANGINAGDYLKNNDSYHFFERIDGLLKTGPTNTNVCDIQILLVR